MRGIFISYRRDDSEGQSGRLYDDLVRRFGDGAVFMDVAGIEPGRDYRKVIDQNVASCGVLLAVIGPSWLGSKDENGIRRLDNPMDFVRLETAAALKRDIPVVPVLVSRARMPSAEQLPDDLKELAYRNAVELTHARWDSDIQVLLKAVQQHIPDEQVHPVGPEGNSPPTVPVPKPTRLPEGPSSTSRRLIVAGISAAVIVVGFYTLHFRSKKSGPSQVPVQPSINAFSVTPPVVTKGQKVIVSWQVANADDVELEPFGQVAANGSTSDEPQQTTLYKLSATNGSGGKSETFQKVIVVEEKKPLVPVGPSDGPRDDSPAAINPPAIRKYGFVELKQTYEADLDSGEVKSDGADIWFEAEDWNHMFLVARNGAQISAPHQPRPASQDLRNYSLCSTATFPSDRWPVTPSTVGKFFCIRTSEGHVSQLWMNGTTGDAEAKVPLTLQLGFSTWEK